MSKKIKKIILNKKRWTSYAKEWAFLTPPEKPSSGEIKIYDDYLQKAIKNCKGKIKALILGVTPELRDLLAKYDVEVTLVDINPNMIKAMNELLEYSRGKEKIIMSNWLNIPLKSNQFDIILCDHGLHHIFFEDWDKLLEEIIRLLKKDGHLIMNIVAIEKRENITVDKMVEIFKNKFFSREDLFYYQYRCFFRLKDIDNKKYYKNLQNFNDELEIFLRKKIITSDQFEFLKTPWAGAKVIFAPKETVDEIMNEYFAIKSVRVNLEHPVFTCHKIYFGQVRK